MAKPYAFKTKLSKENMKIMNSLLSDWYGQDNGYIEVCEHAALPIMSVGEVATAILSQATTADSGKFIEISEKWASLIGMPLAKFTNLTSIKHGVAYVEVTHPALLRELNGSLKYQLITRINQEFDRKICVDMKFIPSGRS